MDGPKESLSAERVLAESGWIHALARRLVGDSGLADDLVQETWIAAMRNPPSEGRPWRPWLAGILRRLVLQWRRGEGRRAHREQDAAQDEPLPSTDDLVDRIETQRVLAKTALELDEPYRTTVLLRYFEGLTSVEIARRQG